MGREQQSLKKQVTPILMVNTLPPEANALIEENHKAFEVFLSPENSENSGKSTSLNFGELLGNFEPKPAEIINVPQKKMNDIAIDFMKFLGTYFLLLGTTNILNLPNSQFHILENGRLFMIIRESFYMGETDIFAVFCKQRKDAGSWGSSLIIQKLMEHPEFVERKERNYSLVKENGVIEKGKGLIFTFYGSEFLLKGSSLPSSNFLLISQENPKFSKKPIIEKYFEQ